MGSVDTQSALHISDRRQFLVETFTNSHNIYEMYVSLIIVFDMIELGFLTLDLSETALMVINICDFFIELFFLGECVVKIYAFGRKYFYDGWYVFDLIITIITVLPLAELSDYSRVARCIRVLRCIRAISHLSELKILIEIIFNSIFNTYLTILLMFFLVYLYAVVGTLMFGVQFGEWFGSLWKSMYTLFQIMTLENWSDGIARTVMVEFPSSWTYFVSYVVLSAIVMYNIIVGIIIETVEETRAHRNKLSGNLEKDIDKQGIMGYIRLSLKEQKEMMNAYFQEKKLLEKLTRR